jgi:hypothetical protein
MTITIRLEGPGLDALRQEAAERGVSLDQLASDIIQSHIRARTGGGPIAGDAKFREAMEGTFRENDELYRRLAK